MSCHDIGHGLNSVVKVVLSEYENGNISYDSAHKIIKQCRDAVHYCDGNSYEALECFEEQGRCMCCLNKTDNLLRVFELPEKYKVFSKKLEKACYGDKLLGGYICEDCIKEFEGG